VTVRKGNNFRSDCSIGINLLLEFPNALFHGVDKESILGDDKVWSSQAGWMVRKGHNFRSDRWITNKLFLEFRMAFSMEWVRNGYSAMMRSGLAWLE